MPYIFWVCACIILKLWYNVQTQSGNSIGGVLFFVLFLYFFTFHLAALVSSCMARACKPRCDDTPNNSYSYETPLRYTAGTKLDWHLHIQAPRPRLTQNMTRHGNIFHNMWQSLKMKKKICNHMPQVVFIHGSDSRQIKMILNLFEQFIYWLYSWPRIGSGLTLE